MFFVTPVVHVLSNVARNHSSASPSLGLANTPFNMSHLYIIRSLLDNTWAMAAPIPPVIVGGNRIAHWWHDTLSTQQRLVSLLLEKGAAGQVQFAYAANGGAYVPEAYAPFTSAAVAGNLYIHIVRNTNSNVILRITNHLGYQWDPVTNDFAAGIPLDYIMRTLIPVISDSAATLPGAELTTGTSWFPPLSASTGIDSTAVSTTITLDVDVVATAATIKANVTNTLTANTLHEVSYKAYVTTDTKELIIPIPCVPQLFYSPDFNSIQFLPVSIGGGPLSSGSFVPYMVKITPYTAADEALITAIGTAGTLNIVFNKDKHSTQVTPANITQPTLTVDIVVLNYFGFYAESNLEYYGLPAYVFMPSAPDYPSITSRLIKLPYTYTKLSDAIVVAPPGFEYGLLYTGGASQAGSIVSGNYVLPVKMQYGWSSIQLGFDFTGGVVTSYRLTCTPSSVIDPAILRSTNSPMSLKIGVFDTHPRDLRVKYRSPSYAPDMRSDDPAEFFYVEVSTIDEFIEVVTHRHTVTTTPANGQAIKLPNLSGQTIDWSGTTQLDFIVEKNTATSGTLTVYVGRMLAATFTVPWIENGHIAYLGTNRGSHLAAAPPMFTLNSPSETLNVTEPANGLLVPPPPTINDYIEVTTEITTGTINANPYVVYYHDKGSNADLYIPYLSGVNPYKPTRFAVIRNIPFTSGPIYEKIVNQNWNGSTHLRSFMIDTTDTVQFPDTTNIPNNAILYSHNAANSGNYQVVMYTGNNWSTNLGTFTAEPVDSPVTYIVNPYAIPHDLLSPLDSATMLHSSRIEIANSEATLYSNSSTGEGSALSLAFVSSSNEAWTFSFRRASIGTYLSGAYFDVIISPNKKEHLFDYNPTDNNLNLLPMPHKQQIRIRFTQATSSIPIVQLSSISNYTYNAPVALSGTRSFSAFDGSELISIGLEKVGDSTILYLYQNDMRIAMTTLAFDFIQSGSIILAHSNGGDSTETLRNLSITAGLRWNNTLTNTPLKMAPVITRAVTGSIGANQTSAVYQLDADLRHAYADCIIHNLDIVPATVSVFMGSDMPTAIARNAVIPPNKSLVLNGNYMASNDTISVHSTTPCNVRVGLVGELKNV